MTTNNMRNIASGHQLDTRAVHAGREDLTELGVHALPIDFSTTNPVGDLDGAAAQIDAFVEGDEPATGSAIYARLHNPTVARFERALADLEHAPAAVAFASGMGALTAVLMALPMEQRHVVAVRPLYGGSDHLLGCDLLGIETTFVTEDAVADAIRSDTSLVIVETPRNPTVDLVDIAAIVAAAGTVPVLVDNTFATPALQQPRTHGATLVLHSATKFLGGHGDAMGGIVACDEEWARKLRQIRIATGAVLHPMGAYHLHRGLATLPIRVRAMQETATELAQRLAAHPAVTRVHHPSLPGADPKGLVGTQMSGPGTMLAIDLKGGYDAARTVLGQVKLMLHAVSLGSTDTLIQHPASLTHRVVDAGVRGDCGIHDGLLRISVGLEDVNDLWADIKIALDACIAGMPVTATTPLSMNGNVAASETAVAAI